MTRAPIPARAGIRSAIRVWIRGGIPGWIRAAAAVRAGTVRAGTGIRRSARGATAGSTRGRVLGLTGGVVPGLIRVVPGLIRVVVGLIRAARGGRGPVRVVAVVRRGTGIRRLVRGATAVWTRGRVLGLTGGVVLGLIRAALCVLGRAPASARVVAVVRTRAVIRG